MRAQTNCLNIFEYSMYGVWGGRGSITVHCTGGDIDTEALHWGDIDAGALQWRDVDAGALQWRDVDGEHAVERH